MKAKVGIEPKLEGYVLPSMNLNQQLVDKIRQYLQVCLLRISLLAQSEDFRENCVQEIQEIAILLRELDREIKHPPPNSA